MTATYNLTSDVCLFHADCREAVRVLPDNCIDSVVCDPPYHLSSIVARFGAENAKPALSASQRRFAATGGADRPPGTDQFGRLSKGFMGKVWDGGDIAFDPATWVEVLRVLKPGGHLVAFGGTRGYHRMTCAIEDAGFEVRDSLMWIYGTGFPKSHDVSKGIDKAAGATPAAQEWEGWGTALKPAFEPIVLARKPLSEGTVAANVLRWRTGALNIGACRVDAGGEVVTTSRNIALGSSSSGVYGAATVPGTYEMPKEGRWPANICHDGSAEVVEAFPTAPGQLGPISTKPGTKTSNVYGKMKREGEASADRRYTERGSTNFAPLPGKRREPAQSAARFFYSAKASKADRAGSKHPTIKPVALMQWLAKLVTPPGGVILDPFAGSGTTGQAAALEGFRCVLVEREAEYVQDIVARFQSPPLQNNGTDGAF